MTDEAISAQLGDWLGVVPCPADNAEIDPRTAGNHLKRRGVATRGPKLTDERIAEAVELYQAGWSLAQIGTASRPQLSERHVVACVHGARSRFNDECRSPFVHKTCAGRAPFHRVQREARFAADFKRVRAWRRRSRRDGRI